jgi:predicted DNA-binding transcriptional regulator AlpA
MTSSPSLGPSRQLLPTSQETSETPPDALSCPDTQDASLLVTARQAAAMCGKSLRTWRSWDAAGWIPRPIRIGRSTLWRVDELRAWAEAGCPRRGEWEAQQ